MKKVIGLVTIVFVMGIVGVVIGSSKDVSDTVLSKCCHTFKDHPDVAGSGS